jgi:hypothetical protein
MIARSFTRLAPSSRTDAKGFDSFSIREGLVSLSCSSDWRVHFAE